MTTSIRLGDRHDREIGHGNVGQVEKIEQQELKSCRDRDPDLIPNDSSRRITGAEGSAERERRTFDYYSLDSQTRKLVGYRGGDCASICRMCGTIARALTRGVRYIYVRVKGASKIDRAQEDEQEQGEQQRKFDQTLAELPRGPARSSGYRKANEMAP
jgi:hypothetical protein